MFDQIRIQQIRMRRVLRRHRRILPIPTAAQIAIRRYFSHDLAHFPLW